MSRRAPPRSAPRRAQTTRAPRPQLKGRGAYNVDSSYKKTKQARKIAKRAPDYEPSLGRNLLTEGGSMLGGLFGMPGLGKSAGSALSNIFGLGSYEVKENVFMEGRLPQVMNVPTGGGTVIRFQEYLGDVITSATVGAFQNTSWIVNSANRDSFPFLAQIAANYEQYQFEGLVYEFRSTSADALNSTNTALGSVMMATQYDFQDTPFTSKAEMLNYEYSNSVKPSENCMHMIECAPSQSVLPILYTLDGSVPAGADSRLYHLGRFQVATIGFQAPSVRIGEIHVTYQVRLLKPKIYSALGLDNDLWRLQSNSYTNALPLGPAVSSTPEFDNFGVTHDSTIITIPPSSLVKNYRLEMYWKGNTTIVTVPTINFVNATALQTRVTTNGTSTQEVFINTAFVTQGLNLPVNIIFGVLGTLPAAGTEVIARLIEVASPA
ncbi:capsid protein [Crucivirus-112]|nr:capsid protein [Crucivirus-112]